MTRKIGKTLAFAALIIIAFIALTACASGKQSEAPQAMVGTWVGLGHHTLPSEILDQKEVAVMLIITEKGDITGYVGDATIQKTYLQKTPWYLTLIGKEKFRANVRLSGDIVRSESFHRDGGILFFNAISNDDLICSFTSDGNNVNSKNMALPIKDIRLSHPEQGAHN